jgi:hypothetical protein
VNQIRTCIEKRFRDKIDTSDLSGKSQEEISKAIFTRGLAAECLIVMASTDIDNAIKSVVDSHDDDGIDAILFNRNLKELFIIQASWIDSGSGKPDTEDVKKFTSSIRDLLDLKLDKFNSKVKRKEPEIRESLEDPSVKIHIAIAYTAKNLLRHIKRPLEDLQKELNAPYESAKFFFWAVSLHNPDKFKIPSTRTVNKRNIPSDIELTVEKNMAFLVFTEWGPEGLIPRPKRLAKLFPEVNKNVRTIWINEFETVDKKIWDFAENIKSTRHTEKSFSIAFKELFPWMDDKSVAKCFFLMNYYIVHEGFDK